MKSYFLSIVMLLMGSQLIAQTENTKSMQDWEYPYPVKTVQLLDSIEVAYVEEGKGEETLVFIHGLGSNLKSWKKNIDNLAEAYRCIALDLPGYGQSSKGGYTYDMSFFANTLSLFIQELKLKKVTLVGHSMGGQVAIHTVLDAPSQIDQLILIAPAGFEQFTESERQWFKTFYTPSFIKSASEAQIIKNFQINFYDMPDDARFMIDDRLYMRQMIEYDHYTEMVPQCVQGMLNQPVFDQLNQLSLPTLIIYGEADQLIPNTFLHPTLTTEAVARSGAEQIPNSQLAFISEAGHFVQWEQYKPVNTIIRRFLKE